MALHGSTKSSELQAGSTPLPREKSQGGCLASLCLSVGALRQRTGLMAAGKGCGNEEDRLVSARTCRPVISGWHATGDRARSVAGQPVPSEPFQDES